MAGGRAILVVDLGFGDSGKGTIVDFLARRTDAHTVVRFNGGPQAGHNVVTPDGRHHTFSQFGSAMFLPQTRTLLSRFMLIEPYALFNESSHLEKIGVRDPLGRLLIDGRCIVITPAHQAANRIRELARRDAAHGTCGMGVGETMADQLSHPDLTLRYADLSDRPTVLRRLNAIVELKREQLRDAICALQDHSAHRDSVRALLHPSWLDAAADNYATLRNCAQMVDERGANRILSESGAVLFEGAQGVLLDEWHGFHPHTTWSTTTFANADMLLDEAAHDGPRTRIGVLRSYMTRHGAGPLVTEDDSLRELLPEPHNEDAGWQGRFRVGHFDAVAARYALAVTGPVDQLAVTHLDRWKMLPPKICTEYRSAGGAFAATSENCYIGTPNAIRDLRVSPVPDLDYQARLTRLCSECRPLLENVSQSDEATLLDRISQELQVSCGIASFGPIADDKRILTPDLVMP